MRVRRLCPSLSKIDLLGSWMDWTKSKAHSKCFRSTSAHQNVEVWALRCLRFRPFAITHFNTIVPTSHDFVPTNRDETTWLVSRHFLLSCYCGHNFQLVEARAFIKWGLVGVVLYAMWLLQLSVLFYAPNKCFYFIRNKHIILNAVLSFCYWVLIRFRNQIGVLHRKLVPIFVTVL
jgi:hypothetical protein